MNKDIQQMIKQRQSANLELVEILLKYIRLYPELRFGQLLSNLGIENDFSQESIETLKYAKEHDKAADAAKYEPQQEVALQNEDKQDRIIYFD